MEKTPLESLTNLFAAEAFEEKEPRFFLFHRSLQMSTWET
jgi:hypothetical protein